MSQRLIPYAGAPKRITSAILEQSRQLRLEGWTYQRIAEHCGVKLHAIFMALKRAGQLKKTEPRKGPQPITDEELRARLRAIPLDTRTAAQIHFDEPAPGRSALDQKRMARGTW